MSMEYIRRVYGVPAKRGMVVTFAAEAFATCTPSGKITGSRGAYLRILRFGDKYSGLYHPTYGIKYPKEK